MQEILNWLYNSLQPLYVNPVVTYQDVSLIISVFKDVKLRTEIFDNQLLLKLYTDKSDNNSTSANLLVPSSLHFNIQIYLPTNYPQLAPIITFTPTQPNTHTLVQNAYLTSSGHFIHPLIETWHLNHGHSVSNDGIPPRENRLLVLLYTMHRLISENPSIWTHQVPSLPPKPSSFISSKTSSTFAPISTSSSELESISSSIKLGNRPNVPPLPKSLQSTKSQVNLQSSKTLTLPAAPPQLPPNPIRITLIQQASTKLNSTLLNLLNGKTEYATIPNISTILENQNDLVNCFDNYHRTENFIVDLNKGIDNNIPVIESKCIDARSLIDSVNKFVDEDYNIDNEELFVSTNKKSKQLSDLCFQEASYLDSLHFLELLFNTQKITFTDYVDNVRKISRERAKLLIWINKFK